MTYAPTVRYLEALAKAAGAASFWHGQQGTQSVNYNAPFPQAHLFLMPANLSGANVEYPVIMTFYGADAYESPANLAEVDPATAQTAADASLLIQDAMDVLSQKFIGLLRDDEDEPFDVSERIDRGPVLRQGSQIGTGFLVSFTLTTRALC